MKAEIINEALTLIPENETESFALNKWFESHFDGCSFIMKPLDLRKDIIQQSYRKPKMEPVVFKAKSIPLPFKISKYVKQLFPNILK